MSKSQKLYLNPKIYQYPKDTRRKMVESLILYVTEHFESNTVDSDVLRFCGGLLDSSASSIAGVVFTKNKLTWDSFGFGPSIKRLVYKWHKEYAGDIEKGIDDPTVNTQLHPFYQYPLLKDLYSTTDPYKVTTQPQQQAYTSEID